MREIEKLRESEGQAVAKVKQWRLGMGQDLKEAGIGLLMQKYFSIITATIDGSESVEYQHCYLLLETLLIFALSFSKDLP